MVWSISVDMGNEACRDEVIGAFNDASERKGLFERFDAYQWPDMTNIFTLTTKGSESKDFVDYQKIEAITQKYPKILDI